MVPIVPCTWVRIEAERQKQTSTVNNGYILYKHKELAEYPIPNPRVKNKTKSELHPSELLLSRHDLLWMNTAITLLIFACLIVLSDPVFAWHFMQKTKLIAGSQKSWGT